MGCIRPATPGFLITLLATGLLAVVVFCVPYFKSVFFLKATIEVQNTSGSITFGTLGYCIELPGNTTCSSPSIGYQLDINGLVGNKLPVEIPQVAVKWITYALVLHVVALVAAAGSALFGLLAHVREMSMTCCSTCISGVAAFVAMLAFIVDLILFFVAKARINQVGSAQIGTAIWLTLAAWILLFFSGCFYTVGRCCISKRPSSGGAGGGGGGFSNKWGRGDSEMGGRRKDDYSEQLRLDAVKAEADRKAAQKKQEVGLPAFYETQPLTARVDGDTVYLDGDNESTLHLPSTAAPPGRKASGGSYAAGYVQGAPGQRAVDEYYSAKPQTPVNSYPPQRQPSSHYTPSVHNSPIPPSQPPALPSQSNHGYNSPQLGYNNYGGGRATTSPPPSNQLLGVPGQYQDPYDQSGRALGHTAGGSSYHTASSQHGEQPSSYSAYNPYITPSPNQGYVETYNPGSSATYASPAAESPYTPPMPNAADYGGAASHNPYIHSPAPQPQHQTSPYHAPERSYTLGGGDAYGASSPSPAPAAPHGYSTSGAAVAGSSSYNNYAYEQPYAATSTPYGHTQSPPPIDTQVPGGYPPAAGGSTSPVKGPRPPPGRSGTLEDAPPGYEPTSSGVQGNWGKR